VDTKQADFNSAAFYAALTRVVEARKVTWRQLARETGITPSTLTRMGQGHGVDGAALARLAAWAGLNPAEYVEAYEPDASLTAISRLLLTTKEIDPEAAAVLEAIFRSAYHRVRHRSKRM
jgi:transcriptional regulator with XRE-family HTH domain